MTPAPAPSPPRWRTISIVAASVLGVVAVVVVACLVLVRTTYFQHAVVRYAAARLSRQIDVRGALELDLLSANPTLTATDVTLSNPAWMPPGVFARIGKLTLVFDSPWPGRMKNIQRLEMISADLHLVRDAEGRANWQRSPPGAPEKGPGRLLRSLYMPDAHVVLDDARRHLRFDGTVTAGDVRAAASPPPLRIEGSGQLNGRAATFAIDGEPLAVASHDKPYAFTFVERSGEAQLRGHGQLLQPFDPGMLDAQFVANGVSMSELYFLAGMHFPNSAPFTLTGKAERRDRRSAFKDLAAHFGRSDLRGTVALEIVDGRSRVNANLASNLLRLSDLGRHEADGSALPATSSASRVLPDSKVPLNGLRNRDAVIRYRADVVESRALSVSAFSAQATIDQGVLTATGISGRLRESHVTGSVKIDVTGEVPRTTLDLTMADLSLAQFARKENVRPPFEGMLQARLAVSGRGDSIHDLAASASGTLALSMSRGAMRASLAEMTAATLRGLGLTLTRSDSETPVRCAVATFRARDGVLSAERIVIETDPIVITGSGDVHLGTEALDLTLRGEPRQPRLLRLRTPVNLAGSLKHPSVRMGKPTGAPVAAGAGAVSSGTAAVSPDAAAVAPGATPTPAAACEPVLAARVPNDGPAK
ncbi:MAG: AsmA family protein [Gammaproteobacteria bacterium]